MFKNNFYFFFQSGFLAFFLFYPTLTYVVCVQLLSKSLDQIRDEVWFAECGDALVKHIPLYANVPDEKVSG